MATMGPNVWSCSRPTSDKNAAAAAAANDDDDDDDDDANDANSTRGLHQTEIMTSLDACYVIAE